MSVPVAIAVVVPFFSPANPFSPIGISTVL
jgi:hypothetical protein